MSEEGLTSIFPFLELRNVSKGSHSKDKTYSLWINYYDVLVRSLGVGLVDNFSSMRHCSIQR